METKHTPGPWKQWDNVLNHQGVYCKCPVESTHPDGIINVAMAFGASEEECKANAELIAQAPDLLAKVSELEALKHSINLDREALHKKVSEQEKEITQLKDWKESEMKLWGPVLDYAQKHGEELGIRLGESISEKILQFLKNRLEQSQRIQQLEGLLKRTLQYNFEPRHPEHPVYKLIAEIKMALNL